FPLGKTAVELLEHGFRSLARMCRPAQRDGIAVDHGPDAEPVFEHGEIGVVVSEEIAHEPDVVEEHHEGFFPAIDRRGARVLVGSGLALTRQWRFPSAGFAGHRAACTSSRHSNSDLMSSAIGIFVSFPIAEFPSFPYV